MARPFACITAQRMISSGDLPRSSAFACVICSGVMRSIFGRLFVQKRTVAPVAEAFAGVSLLRETREHRLQFFFQIGVLQRFLPDAVKPRAGNVAAEPDLIAPGRFADKREFRR